jgi:hypothetical protein
MKYRYNTKQFLIAECANRGLTKRQAYDELKEMVRNQTKPMVFSANVNGRRIPKPIGDQYAELQYSIGRVFKEVGRATSAEFEKEDEITPEEEIQDEPKPVAKAKARTETELEKFKRRIRELRAFCERRAGLGERIDSISMRPAQAAVKLIPLGVPCDALLDAITMHWGEDTRNEAGITSFDFVELSRKVMKDRGIPDGQYHELFGYALLIAEARVPLMLIGPFGTGKSFLAKQISEYLGLAYSETPMSPGATRGDLLGRHTLSGFITSEFVERYSGGGVFNFEEIDASDPSMLIVLNNALASDELFNSSNGERYAKHPDFVPVSTANTFGLGANRDYTGRERLDAATIDRWRTGRIVLPLDEKIEDEILGGTE